VPNAIYGPQDGFIAKLSANGTQLLWATYWGTDDECIIRDIAVDAADNLYPAACIAGGHSSQYITPGAFQTSKPGMRDGLVAKLNPTATQVLWCSYAGGSDNDAATPSIRVDDTGVYFVATTFSSDAPTTLGAYRRTRAGAAGTTDMYVAKLAPNGTSLLWGTYLGGASKEFSETHGVALDAQHNVYVAATTSSTDFPTTAGVVQPSYGGSGGPGSGAETNYPGDGFVAKLSADGHQLLASTYVGGSAGEGIEGVSVGPDGSVHISGATFSANFPVTADAFQPTYHGAGDAFAMSLSGDLTTRLYSSYLGGTLVDLGRAATVDANGNLIVAGMTNSADWPTPSGVPAVPNGGYDCAIGALQLPLH
jgi:hypothetical protein